MKSNLYFVASFFLFTSLFSLGLSEMVMVKAMEGWVIASFVNLIVATYIVLIRSDKAKQ